MGDRTTSDVLFYLMTLQSVFYATRRQFSEVYQMKWFFASTLDFISHMQRHSTID